MTTDTEPTAVGPWTDQAYSVKRHGLTITNCAAEPVQTPGCIQSHGALLVLRRADLTVLQVSENVEHWIDHPVARTLGARIGDLLGARAEACIADVLAAEATERNPTYVFTVPARDGVPPLDVALHTTQGLVILELEASARQAADAADFYAELQHAIARLQGARSLAELSQIACEEIRAITGLDRVMMYKFHSDGHGEVFAEARAAELAPWLGLHYPAEDIPRPAREVFQQIWLRPLPDAQAPVAELVPLLNPETGAPLVMTHCALRAPSVMYTEYLANMGVRASLTLSIRRSDALWGLIAGHHLTATHFSWQLRAACELFAQITSLQHQAAEDREELAYRLRMEDVQQQLVAAAAQDGELAAMALSTPSLVDAMEAGGAALYHRGRWWRIGATPSELELDALASWLFEQPELSSASRPVYACDALARVYPAAAAFAACASGVLAIPLARATRSMMVWFRPEVVRTVRWAGRPDDKPMVVGPHGPRLTPRRSFELFVESVQLRARPWKGVEIDAALRLRVLAMELVVAAADRLSDLNALLLRSNDELDAFAYVASHDLKEPLRGIYKYAHQLANAAAPLDEEQTRRLDGILRLTSRMDNLLESLLQFSRVGRATLHSEPVDLNAVLAEALDMVNARVAERATEIAIPRPLPRAVCDHVRVREVFSNLLSNALKYNDKPVRQITVGYLAPAEYADQPAMVTAAAGRPIYFVTDNGIGIHAKHHEQVFRLFRRLHGPREWGGGTGAGLTIVQKLVERQGGRIWLGSDVGERTTFYFTLGDAPP